MDWYNGSSETASRILIFSIAMGAAYSFELIFIVHRVAQFFMHNKLILGRVTYVKVASPIFSTLHIDNFSTVQGLKSRYSV